MRALVSGLVCGVCLATCGSPSASVDAGASRAGASTVSALVTWAGALGQQQFVVHLSCPDGRRRVALQMVDDASHDDPRGAGRRAP